MCVRRLVLFLLLPALIGAGSYFAARSFYQEPVLPSVDAPQIEVPDVVELGLCKPGQREARFVVSNTGRQPLELSRFQSSCACMVLREHKPGASSNLERITLPAGSSLPLIAHVNIGLNIRGRFRTSISFLSNDPTRTEVVVPVVAEVEGSIIASPSHLLLGQLQRGVTSSHVVTIRDSGRSRPCCLTRVESDCPAVVW